MAYGTKYRTEFKDNLNLLWRIDIEKDGYTSTMYTREPTDNPLTIEVLNNGEDWFTNNIHGSVANINMYCPSDFEFVDLYSYGDLTWRVSIYYGASYTLYWRGYIYSDGYSEGYDAAPYPINITANDGLGMLKDKPFKYTTTVEDDTYYNGRLTEAYIIYEILSKVNLTEFKEFINIYESNMQSTTSNSVLDQCYIDVDVFKDMNCYEVLGHILSKYGAVASSYLNQVYLYRPVELSQATIYGRYYTSATSYTSITLTPEQWINRSDEPTNFIQPEGGILALQNPVKKITIKHDYGYKTSWIDGYDFRNDDYISSTGNFSGWSKSGSTNTVLPLRNKLPREEQGIIMTGTSDTEYIYRTFGDYAISTASNNVFNFSFDYQYYNGYGSPFTGSTVTDPAIQIRDNTNTYYLYEIDDEYCGWTTTPSYINITSPDPLEVGGNGWVTYSRKIAGLPISGPYTIRIYKGYSAVSLISRAIKDVKFIATSDTLIIKAKRKSRWSFSPWWTFALGIGSVDYKIGGKREITGYDYSQGIDHDEVVDSEYEVTNSLKGDEISNDYILGDVTDITYCTNIIEQFDGALAVNSLNTVASKFVSNWASTYLSGGVVLTSSTNVLTFESSTAGVNFTGSTTITNTSGNLTGTVTNVQANVAAQAKIMDITFSGSSGDGEIVVNDIGGAPFGTITYTSSISTSINNFITNYTLDFNNAGYTLSHPSTYVLRITSNNTYDFDVAYFQTHTNLAGSVSTYQTYIEAKKRKDTITLSGTSGAANILCDGTTKSATYTGALTYTNGVWSTSSPGSESTQLLHILADNIRMQYNRAIPILDIPIIEQNYSSANPILNTVCNIRDSFKIDSVTGDPSYFFINGTEFNVRDREWTLHLMEIVTTE